MFYCRCVDAEKKLSNCVISRSGPAPSTRPFPYIYRSRLRHWDYAARTHVSVATIHHYVQMSAIFTFRY